MYRGPQQQICNSILCNRKHPMPDTIHRNYNNRKQAHKHVVDVPDQKRKKITAEKTKQHPRSREKAPRPQLRSVIFPTVRPSCTSPTPLVKGAPNLLPHKRKDNTRSQTKIERSTLAPQSLFSCSHPFTKFGRERACLPVPC